jgi:hypothetical protein
MAGKRYRLYHVASEQSKGVPVRGHTDRQEMRIATKKPATYCNPFWNGSLPDPFVLKVRWRYYAYGTEREKHSPPGQRSFLF